VPPVISPGVTSCVDDPEGIVTGRLQSDAFIDIVLDGWSEDPEVSYHLVPQLVRG
jgi:hypothetical protein